MVQGNGLTILSTQETNTFLLCKSLSNTDKFLFLKNTEITISHKIGEDKNISKNLGHATVASTMDIYHNRYLMKRNKHN